MTVKTQPQLNAEIQTSFPDNVIMKITPSLTRQMLQDITDTMFTSVSGGLTNQRQAKTGTYAVLNVDKGTTLALGGSAFYTLIFSAASGYDANFLVTVVNEDTARAKRITLTSGDSFLLWPGQSILVLSQNNLWRTVGRSRWKLPNSITVYVNASFGDDTNDGLAPLAGALATVQAALYQVTNNFDYLSSTTLDSIVTIQMQANDTTGVHFGTHGLTGAASGGDITLDGGGFSISCTGDTDDAMHLFFGAILYLQNITIIPGTNHGGLNLDKGATAFLKSGCAFGASAAGSSGPAQLQVQAFSSLEVDASYSINGSSGYHIYVHDGGQVSMPGAPTITFTSNAAFANVVIATNCGIANFSGASFALGGHTITGKRWEADNLSLIVSNTGVPDTFFPGSINGSTSGGGQGV